MPNHCNKQRIPWLFLLLGPLFLLLFSAKRAAARQAAFEPEAVDRFIEEQMAAQRLPGLGLAITQGDQILYVKGYGSDGNGRPVTPQTQFFTASLSKSFTAIAVMQLVEAGLVDLDAPVQTYLPEFTLADPQTASRITIRHLLNHTSGLSEAGFPDMELPQPETIQERVTSLRSAPAAAPPGTEYHYFNPNYGVLARVVEVVSGMPFSQYLVSHIFTPLDMADTLNVDTTTEGERAAPRLAHGHLVLFGVPYRYPEVDGYLGGSGGVISTAEDMAHYLIVQNNGGRYRDRELVSAESMAQMHTPPEGIDSDYAMGWSARVEDGRRLLEHNGVISTYSADALLLPDEGYGIALLYNVSSFPTIALASPQIKRGLVAILNGEQPDAGGMNVGLLGWIMAGLTLIGGFLAVRSLLRLPRWAQWAKTAPRWRLLAGIAWAFAPALALLALPALSARFSGRVFGFANFYKSMLDVLAWLGLTGVLGLISGSVRIGILLKRFARNDRDTPENPAEMSPRF